MAALTDKDAAVCLLRSPRRPGASVLACAATQELVELDGEFSLHMGLDGWAFLQPTTASASTTSAQPSLWCKQVLTRRCVQHERGVYIQDKVTKSTSWKHVQETAFAIKYASLGPAVDDFSLAIDNVGLKVLRGAIGHDFQFVFFQVRDFQDKRSKYGVS